MRLAADPHPVTRERYDAWYDAPSRRRIGELRGMAVRDALRSQADDTVLDVGCETGWFMRGAVSVATQVVTLDVDQASLEFARYRGTGRAECCRGDATCLPFADAAFDKVMSIAAPCFVSDWPRAVAEIARVCRDRFAIGLLNRHSLLYLMQGTAWRHRGLRGRALAHKGRAGSLDACTAGRAVEDSYGVFDASGSSAAACWNA